MTSVSRQPDMILYAVKEYRDGKEIKGHWMRIGAAWRHKDGVGYNIRQDFVPLGKDYSIVLREPLPDDRESGQDTDIPFEPH